MPNKILKFFDFYLIAVWSATVAENQSNGLLDGAFCVSTN